jgi:hypothetical protein
MVTDWVGLVSVPRRRAVPLPKRRAIRISNDAVHPGIEYGYWGLPVFVGATRYLLSSPDPRRICPRPEVVVIKSRSII